MGVNLPLTFIKDQFALSVCTFYVVSENLPNHCSKVTLTAIILHKCKLLFLMSHLILYFSLFWNEENQ